MKNRCLFFLIFLFSLTSCSIQNIEKENEILPNKQDASGVDAMIVGNVDQSCVQEFLDFSQIQAEYAQYDLEIIYYDLLRKNESCLLGYYYSHEVRHYWKVIDLSMNYTELFDTSCMPDYNPEQDEFTYCTSEDIDKTHKEYQGFIAEFL